MPPGPSHLLCHCSCNKDSTNMVSLKEMARADAERVPSAWLLPMLEAKFFEPCPEHPEASRATSSGGCNLFCIDCTGRTLCHACITNDHAGHRVIQVRRSSNHNAVKVKDVEALLNIDGVHPYLINSENAVFLNPRPQAGDGMAGEHRCKDCSRALRDKAYHFCSLRCKLECMEGDINISFAVQPASESESSEDETETDDDALFHPTKRLRKTASRSERLGRGNRAEEDGTGTSAAPGHQ